MLAELWPVIERLKEVLHNLRWVERGGLVPLYLLTDEEVAPVEQVCAFMQILAEHFATTFLASNAGSLWYLSRCFALCVHPISN